MENIDTASTEYFTDPDDYDETVWHEVHGPSSVPTLPVPGTRELFRQGPAGLADQNRHIASRNPSPVNSQLPGAAISYRPPARQVSGCTVAPLPTPTPFVPPAPPPEVPSDLQTLSTSELQQRLLIPNCEQLIEVLSQIIDDPDRDRFVLDGTRQVLTTRIKAIKAAIAWRSSFEPSANALGLEVMSGTSFLGPSTRSPTTDHVNPMAPPIPGPPTLSPAKGVSSLSPAHCQAHISASTLLRAQSRERLYPRLPNENVKLPSPRRPRSAMDGAKQTISRESSWLTLGQSDPTSATDMETFDPESDGSDTLETHITKPPKAPPLTPLSSFDSIQDVYVTTRPPRKRRGINALPPSNRSGSSLKMNPNNEPTTMNAPTTPLPSIGSTSNHLVHEDAQQGSFNPPDSGLRTLAQVEEPWKNEIMDKLKTVFGLKSFRTNQAQAIDATMSGQDVFVLMPTGGGKSLCYQLPAVCTSGRTKGVTFVVSPLKSLMDDQVRQLRNKGIDVILFNSDQSSKATAKARKRLVDGRTKPSLVYVTPEKLEASEDMRQILNELMLQGELARFVIDEAHCISTWGQDFRTAYEGLGFLRQSYPGIPIMALTATANARVRHDIITKLGIPDCIELVQSFNRPNLHYEIRQKRKGVVTDIANYIRSHYPRQSGVIYCFSRKKCEGVAKALRDKHSINARHYHAGMTANERSVTLGEWISGNCEVIVATVAFGMGIDKPDVRFVIHHQIPMSLSGYYQETGRAGRDGKPAHCVLYYHYTDRYNMDRVIEKGGKDGQAPPAQAERQRQKDEIRQVVQYCQNTIDCRRSQILAYFGERFNPTHCCKTCDNCASHSEEMSHEDLTKVACMALELVQSIKTSRPILNEAIDAFRGSKRKGILDKGFNRKPMFGKGSEFSLETVERLFHHLLSKGALKEEYYQNAKGFSIPFIELGDCAGDYRDGRKKFILPIRLAEKNTEGQTAETMVSASNKYQPPATTQRTAAEKLPSTTSRPSKDTWSMGHADVDWADSDDADDSSSAESRSGVDDIGEMDHFWAPDLEAIEAQKEGIPTDAPMSQVNSLPSDSVSNLDEKLDTFVEQLGRLRKRRENLANLFGLDDPEIVFREEVLEELALLNCTNEEEFKQSLRSALGSDDDFNEKFELFGKSFMELCLTKPPHHENGPENDTLGV